VFSISPKELGLTLIYDVAHNIAKIEEHVVNGKRLKLVVHRKGATRAFPPHNPDVPPAYREIGQPVLLPGDVGRYSFLLVGQEKSMDMSFGSACHGAGRLMSRTKAKEFVRKEGLEKVLGGLVVVARGKGTVAEEIPQAYKDVSEVAYVVHSLGIARLVARFKPLGTLKG
ncbi:MAG: RtcB family protein, partial [Aquificaceae bacterium]